MYSCTMYVSLDSLGDEAYGSGVYISHGTKHLFKPTHCKGIKSEGNSFYDGVADSLYKGNVWWALLFCTSSM